MAYEDLVPFASPTPALPEFFADPRLLCYQNHGDLGIRRGNNLRFAACVDAIPLTLGEFTSAMRSYPIVFEGDEMPVPVAIVGLERRHNLFVDALGGWRQGHYVPSCLQYYPLISMPAENGERELYADFASGRIVTCKAHAEPDVEPLFDAGGAPSAYCQSVTARCRVAERSLAQSVAFAHTLQKVGVLVPCNPPVAIEDDGQTAGRFRMVDEQAFRALPAPVLARFAALGWLEPIVMSIVARQNWHSLSAMMARPRIRQREAA